MNPSSALPMFPLDPRSGVGVRVSRQGTGFRFDAEEVPLRTTGSGSTFVVSTPGGPIPLRDGAIFAVVADRSASGDVFLTVDDNAPRPLLAASGQPLPRLISGRAYRFRYDAALAAFVADGPAIVQNEDLAAAAPATLKGNPGSGPLPPVDLGVDEVWQLLGIDDLDDRKAEAGNNTDITSLGGLTQAAKNAIVLVAQATINGTTRTVSGWLEYLLGYAAQVAADAQANAITTLRGGVADANNTLAKLAASITAAAQGNFPAATLAELNANTTALQGSVDNDGANNGSYARQVRSDPSTPWVRVSTATLSALDAMLRALGVASAVNFARVVLNANGTLTSALPAAPGGSSVRAVGADGALAVVSAEAYGGQPFFTLRRARGTASAPGGMKQGDMLGFFGGGGFTDAGAFADYTGRLNLVAAEDFSPSRQGSIWTLSAAKRGTTSQFQMLSLDPDNGATFGIQAILPDGSTAGGRIIGGLVSLNGSPGTGDLPAGRWIVAKDTTTGRCSLWVNDGGQIKDLLNISLA